MRTKNILIAALPALLLIILFIGVNAQADLPEWYQGEGTVLHPGAATFCSKNFTIENKGSSDAEVDLILGNEKFSQETIPLGNTRSYDLRENLSKAKLMGKAVSMKDSAFIMNISPDSSNLRVYCEEERMN